MKKIKSILLIMILAFIMCSCADSKTFTVNNGDNESIIHVEPYGWMNQNQKIDNVQYQLCVGNIVWSIILCETIIVPIILTGVALYEPVAYNYPTK